MFNDVPVAAPISGVVSANDAASFAVVIEAAAILAVPIAPASKPGPAERLLTKVSIEPFLLWKQNHYNQKYIFIYRFLNTIKF